MDTKYASEAEEIYKTVVTGARYNKDKDCEQNIIHMGTTLHDYAVVKALLEDKYKEILVLKKRCKVPEIQQVQTPELMCAEYERNRIS